MMDTHGALGEIGSTDSTDDIGLTCAICIKTYKNPKLLDCSHTFCEPCILTHLQKLQKDGLLEYGIECPLCRKLTSTEKQDSSLEEWVMALPANEALISTLDTVNSGSENVTSPGVMSIMCQPCEHTGKSFEAVFYCSDCNEYQCMDCSGGHQRYSALRNHKPVRIKESQSAEIYSRKVQQYEKCEVHSKPIEFICVKHNDLCCSTCSIITHRECKEFKEIKDLNIQGNKNKMRTLKIATFKVQNKMKSIAKYCRDHDTKLARQEESIILDIERMKKKIVDLFDKLMLRAKEQASVLRKKRNEDLKAKIDLCMNIEKSLDDILLTQEAVLHHGTPTQIFITAHKLTQNLEDHEKDLKKRVAEIDVTDLSLSSSDLFQKMIDLDEDLMKLSEATSVMGVEKIPDYRLVQLELLETTEIDKSVSDEDFPLITGLTYLSDGRLIAVDNKLAQYLVLDDKNKLLNKAPLDKWPGGAVSHADDTIAVAEVDNKTISLYGISADNTLQRTSTVSTTVSSFSISLAGRGKYVVGTYKGNKPACFVLDNGEVVDINAEFPDRQYYIGDTRCVYIPDSGKLVLTVRDDNTVRIYDTRDGTEVIVRDDRINFPRGVAVSDSGCIFVCSLGTNSIVQISLTGEVIGLHKLESMENPNCVCISRDGRKLAMGNNSRNNPSLQIFKIC